jgi:hypothetical protein
MAIEEHRRIALHRAAAESWGEENADTLMDSIAPAGHELATRQDIDGILAAMDAMDERWDERLTAMDRQWDERLTAMDQRWDERLTAMDQQWGERLDSMDQRWDERLTAMDRRWGERLDGMDERWQIRTDSLRDQLSAIIDRRVTDAVNTQTRALVISVLVALVAITGLAFGLN